MTMDDIPDLFTFSFASIKKIGLKYGMDSANYRAVIYLIDEAIVSAIRSLSSIYGNKLAAQIVFMGPTADQVLAANTNARIEVGLATIHTVRRDVFDNNFPSLYVVDHSKHYETCNTLELLYKYDVYCATELDAEVLDLFPPLTNQTTNSTVYGKDAATFQICLWIPIILVLGMLAVIIAFCNMDVGADSMLYRSTNLRHQHAS